MKQEFRTNVVETKDATPQKEQTYNAGNADLSVEEALMELIDNAIDNSKRPPKKDSLSLSIIYEDGIIKVRDDTGGVKYDNIIRLISYGLGAGELERVENQIGAYNVGMKKAFFKLAEDVQVRTRHESSDTTYGFRVGSEWLKTDPTDYSVDVLGYPEEPLSKGTTEIILADLKFDWDNRIDTIKKQLEDTYEMFLKQGTEFQDLNINIQSNGEYIELQPPESPSWAYLPDMYPICVKNIRIDKEVESREFEEPLIVNITAGHKTGTSDKYKGTHLYIQGRNILRYAKDHSGGYNGSHNRLMNERVPKTFLCIIDIRTNGDSSKIPWTSVKTDVEERSEIMEEIYNAASRATKSYRDFRPIQDSGVSQIKAKVLSQYDKNSDHAANDGNIKQLNNEYKWRIDFDECNKSRHVDKYRKIYKKAIEHAVMHIRDVSEIKKREIPLYDHFRKRWKKLLHDEIEMEVENVNISSYPKIKKEDSELDNLDVEEVRGTKLYKDLSSMKEINGYIRKHAGEQIRFDKDDISDKIEEYKYYYYRAYLDSMVKPQRPFDQLDLIDTESQNSTQEDEESDKSSTENEGEEDETKKQDGSDQDDESQNSTQEDEESDKSSTENEGEEDETKKQDGSDQDNLRPSDINDRYEIEVPEHFKEEYSEFFDENFGRMTSEDIRDLIEDHVFDRTRCDKYGKE